LEGLLANSHLLDHIVVFVLVSDLIDIASVSVGWCTGHKVSTDMAIKLLVQGLWAGYTDKHSLLTFLEQEQHVLDNLETTLTRVKLQIIEDNYI